LNQIDEQRPCLKTDNKKADRAEQGNVHSGTRVQGGQLKKKSGKKGKNLQRGQTTPRKKEKDQGE